MTPAQWTLVERLYHAAGAVPFETREAWLERECDGHDLVRREVESLLAQNASTPNALDAGAFATTGHARGENLTGRHLGGYNLLELIGEGGMGQVYRARDTNLKRDVALKVLPASFSSDPSRLARFQREAEVLASLNHPNIAAAALAT